MSNFMQFMVSTENHDRQFDGETIYSEGETPAEDTGVIHEEQLESVVAESDVALDQAERGTDANEEAVAAMEGFESSVALFQEAIERSNYSLESYNVATHYHSMANAINRLGFSVGIESMDSYIAVPSVESIENDPSNREQQLQASLEGVKEFAANVWKKIVQMFRRSIEFMKNLFTPSRLVSKKIEKRVAELSRRIDDLNGAKAKSGFEISEKYNKFLTFKGSLTTPSDVVKKLDNGLDEVNPDQYIGDLNKIITPTMGVWRSIGNFFLDLAGKEKLEAAKKEAEDAVKAATKKMKGIGSSLSGAALDEVRKAASIHQGNARVTGLLLPGNLVIYTVMTDEAARAGKVIVGKEASGKPKLLSLSDARSVLNSIRNTAKKFDGLTSKYENYNKAEKEKIIGHIDEIVKIHSEMLKQQAKDDGSHKWYNGLFKSYGADVRKFLTSLVSFCDKPYIIFHSYYTTEVKGLFAFVEHCLTAYEKPHKYYRHIK